MKKTALFATALVLSAAGALAQQHKDGMAGMPGMETKKGMPEMSGPNKQTTHSAKGVVKKIDAKAGMVTVAHGPVSTMSWPAMTMAFKVKDKAMIDKFAEGKEVEFVFEKQGKEYVIDSVK